MANLPTARYQRSPSTDESLKAIEAADKLDGGGIRLGRPALQAPRSRVIAAVFIIDPRSGVPHYLQLNQQVKRAVSLGTLAPGEQLPTVKSLALELVINANTVARAYRELEREQIIETSPGRGSFVRGGEAPHESRVTDAASAAFDEAVRVASNFGMSGIEIIALFDRVLERWFPAERGENS